MIERNQKICSRCILDTTVPGIKFGENDVCNYCKIHDKLEEKYPLNESGQKKFNQIISEIKRKGKNKKYGCIVGVSGGRDSTYALYMAVKLGLRPLAVHFDNGWNSEIAANNIKKAITKLNVDLHTVVANWEEFKDLQVSFLKASVPDAEVPTDWVICSVLFQVAAQEGIKYVIEGHSFRTEGTSPIGWTYMDGRYLNSVHRIFGKKRIKSFPILTLSKLVYYTFLRRIKEFRILEHLEYNQKEVEKVIKEELDWVYYGGHHHESRYTHFVQSYLLPKKFGIDKRKTEYSALVRSGQMTRTEALRKINESAYPTDEELVNYCIKKLGLTREEFNKIMSTKPKSFHNYPTYYPLIRALKFPIKVASNLNLLPKIVYLKYFS